LAVTGFESPDLAEPLLSLLELDAADDDESPDEDAFFSLEPEAFSPEDDSEEEEDEDFFSAAAAALSR
jgi:hypothetical protein